MPDPNEFKVSINIDLDDNDAPKAADALDGVAKKSKEATDAAHEHGHSEREVREELRMLGEQAGPMGEMLRFAFSGPLLALSAFAAAVEAVKGEFAKLAAVVDQFNEAQRAISDAKIKAVADATHAAALAAVEAADAEAKLNAAYADGDTAMTNRLKLYDDEIAALKKLEDAKEKAFEADLDRLVKLGKITKDQADDAKEDARLQMDKFQGSADQAKLQNKITERQKQLAEAQKNVQSGADQQAIDAARAAETSSKSKIAEYDAAIKAQDKTVLGVDSDIAGPNGLTEHRHDEGTIEDLKKQASKVRDQAENAAERGDDESAAGFTQEADAIERAIKGQETYLANLEKLKTAAEGANATAKTATEIAEEKAKHDQEIVRIAPAQIETLQKQAQIQATSNTQVQAVNAQAAYDRTAPSDDGIQSGAARERGPQAQIDSQKTAANARELEARLRNQKNPSSDDLQAVHEAIERMMGYLENSSVSTARKVDIEDIWRRLNVIENARHAGFGDPGHF